MLSSLQPQHLSDIVQSLQVAEGWLADDSRWRGDLNRWYFKLMRLPDQPPLQPHKIAFPRPVDQDQVDAFNQT